MRLAQRYASRMNNEELSGRELDAAVAQHVFGLEVEERTNTRTGEQDFVYRQKSGQDWVLVAYYGSLTASLDLEFMLRKLGWTLKPSPLGRQPDASGVVRAVLVNEEREVEGTGRSFEEALCRSGVKATEEP